MVVTGRSVQEGLEKAGDLQAFAGSKIRIMSLENEGLDYEGKKWIGFK